MHMYLKCFFALSGNLKVQIVYAAASQCNVSSDSQGVRGFIDGIKARYKQALRHMWGAMDTGYAVRQTLEMFDRHYSLRCSATKSHWDIEEHLLGMKDILLTVLSTLCTSSWASFRGNNRSRKLAGSSPTDATSDLRKPIQLLNLWTLFHRLFEAHFLPTHLVVILTTSAVYDIAWGPLVPRELALALYICSICRWIGWTLIVIFFYRYEKYHQLCVAHRQEEMRKAGLLKDGTEHYGFCHSAFLWFGLLEAGIFPLGGFIYGALPACQAILSHVFTDKLAYQVSLKPQLDMRAWTNQTL